MADDYKVPVTKILEILPHTNSDHLEFCRVFDFKVVVRKNEYKVGQEILYVPIDSVLPKNIEEKLFPADSKIKLHNSRVKQIKIRGFYSQGMLIDLEDIYEFLGKDRIRRLGTYEENEDLSSDLGITKYEPPAPNFAGQAQKRDKPRENPLFHKYNGVENIKWYPDLFTPDEDVVVQEKLHGSNCRAAILPWKANTLWKKIVKFFGLAPEFEYCYGSNNVQLQERKDYKGFYGSDVYGAVLNKIDAFKKMKPNEIIYGELIGEGIQKNYHYGHKDHHFVLFNVKLQTPEGAKWLNPKEAQNYAKERGFDFVPVLYEGKFNKEHFNSLVKTPSSYYPAHKIMEGLVIKSLNDYNNEVLSSAKKELKLINEEYLNKDQSDYH